MSSSLDLKLPEKASNDPKHYSTLGDRHFYAIYSLADLGNGGLQALEDEINSAEYAQDTCCLAPKADFCGKTLRDVYDYHVKLRETDPSYHPLYFIVATDADYKDKGVLAVHLDCDQINDGRIGKGRCGVDMAASWGMNLDIGNQSWYDLKEEEAAAWEEDPGWAREVQQKAEENQRASEEVRKPALQYGCWTLVSDLPQYKLHDRLDPDNGKKTFETFRFAMAGDWSSEPDPWKEMVRLHPWYCKTHPEVHRQLAVAVDKQDLDNKGVALVKYDWDGNTDKEDDNSITSLDLHWTVLKRVPPGQALGELDGLCEELNLPRAMP